MSSETYENGINPLDPVQSLKSPPSIPDVERVAHPQNTILADDSAVTKAEKIERHGGPDDFPESEAKRIKVDFSANEEAKGILFTHKVLNVTEAGHSETMMRPKEQHMNPLGNPQTTEASEKRNPGAKTPAEILAPPRMRLVFVAQG
ncbi:MAG: hypothetical protein Q9198_003218 [Flavoplaca austrocitrina]